MKGLPLAYNRDLQEDKAALFTGVDTTLEAIVIAGRVAATMRIHPERMQAMTKLGFLNATDVADELVGGPCLLPRPTRRWGGWFATARRG